MFLLIPLTTMITATSIAFQQPGLLEKPSISNLTAQAKTPIRFILPEKGTPRKRTSSGTRGCPNQSQSASLTLLVPQENTGWTVSSHPTFFWYLSEATPTPVKFSLVEAKRGGRTIFEKWFPGQKAGIVHLEMPPDLPELIIGQEYRWTVAWACDRDRPSTYVVYQSWIKRVAIAPELFNKLQLVTDEQEKARMYAESGLWYDALSSLVKAYTVQPDAREVREDIISLLGQLGITQVRLE